MVGSEFLEIKRTLDGREHRFACTLLHQSPGWVALRYVLAAPAAVGSLVLPAGAETVAHYWPDRPYTAYHWFDGQGRPLGIYLNAAAGIEFGPGEIRWTDLALDVLVTPVHGIEVLDDDEARAAPQWAQPAIAGARTLLLSHAAAIAAEVAELSAAVRQAPAARSR
jgi:predicted RNA-binding protein associated with RNAse of E/G family